MSTGEPGEWIPLPIALFILCDSQLAERLMQVESLQQMDAAMKSDREATDQHVGEGLAQGRLHLDALRRLRSGELVARGWRHDLNEWVLIDALEYSAELPISIGNPAASSAAGWCSMMSTSRWPSVWPARVPK